MWSFANNLVTKLYSVKLLSGDQKSNIDSQPTNKEKAKYFLDSVIEPSLKVKFTKLFDEMVKVMITSDNPTVNYLVDEVRKFSPASIPAIPARDGEKESTPKGNYYGLLLLIM